MSFEGRPAERAEPSGESFCGAKPILKLSEGQRLCRAGARGSTGGGHALAPAFGMKLEPFGAEHEAAFGDYAVADGEPFQDREASA
jgi:hypothetical protein